MINDEFLSFCSKKKRRSPGGATPELKSLRLVFPLLALLVHRDRRSRLAAVKPGAAERLGVSMTSKGDPR